MGNSAMREEESNPKSRATKKAASSATSEDEDTNAPGAESGKGETQDTESTSSMEENEPVPTRTLRKRPARSESATKAEPSREKKGGKSKQKDNDGAPRRSSRQAPPPELYEPAKPDPVTSSSKKTAASKNQKSTAATSKKPASSSGGDAPNLRGVAVRPNDMLFGRGEYVANRPKMVEFRDYCFDKLADFVKSEGDQEKRDALVQNIFDLTVNQRPKGRFLALRDNRVDQLNDGEAMSRIRQMFFNLLRNHAPDVPQSAAAKKKDKVKPSKPPSSSPPTTTSSSRAATASATTTIRNTTRLTRRDGPPLPSTRYGRQVRPVKEEPLEMTKVREDRVPYRILPPKQPAAETKSSKKTTAKPAPKLPPGHILEKAIRDNDVLLGLGPPAAGRVGNTKFREFSEGYQKDFDKLFRQGEMEKIDSLTAKIVGMVRSLKPPGRFLDWKGSYYLEVDDKEANARARKMFMNRRTKSRQRKSSSPPKQKQPAKSSSRSRGTVAEPPAKKRRVAKEPDPPPKSVTPATASSRKSSRTRAPPNRSDDYEYQGSQTTTAAGASSRRGSASSSAPPPAKKASSTSSRRGESSSTALRRSSGTGATTSKRGESSSSTSRKASGAAAKRGGESSSSAPRKASGGATKRSAQPSPPRGGEKKRRGQPPISPQARAVTVRTTDVILGRGSAISSRPGNQQFHEFVSQMRCAYIGSGRDEKSDIAYLVVQMVKAQNPPGRFLIQQGRIHVQVSEDRAIEKAAQALREKCFKDRDQLEALALADIGYDEDSHSESEDSKDAEEPDHDLMAPHVGSSGPAPLEEPQKESPRLPVYLHRNDVILDSVSAGHPGNENFEEVCRSVSGAFSEEAGRPIAQLEIAQEVFFTVQAQEPPGRFVERVGDQFFEVTESVAVNKVRQAIHDCSVGVETSFVTSPSSSVTVAKDPQVRLRTKGDHENPEAADVAALGPGQRISVYWDHDESYYEATILAKDANLHHIEYIDDGVKEWIDLSLHTIKLVSTEQNGGT